ncbi:hypothetical protein [Zhongshania sp.]|uniref:hypothetical protein n=1 Tax=Zhongshania sp. TaxID=1971902 RepID=UPI0035614A93
MSKFELAKEETLQGLKDQMAVTGISEGRKVVAAAGTAEALVPASTPCKHVIIAAETNNTGVIAVGGTGVVAAEATREGIPLSAGDPPLHLDVTDLADVHLDTTIAGDGVTFTYLV